jgi:hypothetical protein
MFSGDVPKMMPAPVPPPPPPMPPAASATPPNIKLASDTTTIILNMSAPIPPVHEYANVDMQEARPPSTDTAKCRTGQGRELRRENDGVYPPPRRETKRGRGTMRSMVEGVF